MIDVELMTPHHVTIGYTGEPGSRTFYFQAQDTETHVTLLLEKVQAEGIADLLAELLTRLDDEPATDWDRAAMGLRDPIQPRWRVGEIALGLDPDAGRFALELTEFVPESLDDPIDPIDPADPTGPMDPVDPQDPADPADPIAVPEPREVRIWTDRDQARRLAAHAAELVAQGRPRCELCGRPTELDGSHVCPSTNGHGRLTR